MKTYRRIGFAGTYYTLWDICAYISYGYDQLPYQTIDYNYIQNLSTDETKAVEKAKLMGATDLIPDDELFGRNRSWKRQTKLFSEIPKSKSFFFEFGKNRGNKIMDCDDYDYLYWYFNSTSNIHAKSILLKNGYHDVDGIMLTEAEYLNYISYHEKQNSIKKGSLITITQESNIRRCEDGFEIKTIEHGWMCIIESISIKYHEYKGFGYYLPTINGVGKKIKNKLISVTTNSNGTISEFNL